MFLLLIQTSDQLVFCYAILNLGAKGLSKGPFPDLINSPRSRIKPTRSGPLTGTIPTAIVEDRKMKTLYWFRKALRVQDNPSLVKSIIDSTHLDPVFCIDPWFVSSGKVGVNRMGFLLESLTDLDINLRKLGSRLIVLHGNPVEVIPK